MVSTVTPYEDMAPSPRVVIDIDDTELDPLCVTATVLQVSKWGQVPVNRKPRAVAGGLIVNDYEVPPGVQVTYRVQQYSASGQDLGITLSLSTQVNVPFGKVLIADPLAPGDAVMLDGEIGFASELTRARPSQVYQAGSRTFAMSGLYSAFREVNLTCFTDTTPDRERLGLILEQPVILVRAHPSTGLPGSLYATVPQAVEDTVGIARSEVETAKWRMSGNEVNRPSIDIIVAIFSYDLYRSYLIEKYGPGATYDNAASEWSRYVDALRFPPSLGGV